MGSELRSRVPACNVYTGCETPWLRRDEAGLDGNLGMTMNNSMSRVLWTSLIALSLAALPARAQFKVTETFRGTTAPGWTISGTNNAGTDDSGILTAGVGALPNNVNDGAGNGWLRLTTNSGGQTGQALYTGSSFSSAQGAVVEFEYVSWGGSGADGMSLFLYDAAATMAGAVSGASLGYCSGDGGYLGIGLDEFGNFSSNGAVGRCPNSDGPGNQADRVVVRGPRSANNPYIGNAAVPAPGIDVPGATARPAPNRVRYFLVPNGTGGYRVTVGFGANGATPTTILNALNFPYVAPAQWRIGAAGSTGGATNIHELRNVAISTPADILVTKSVAAPAILRGQAVQYTVVVRNNDINPLDAGDQSPPINAANAADIIDNLPAQVTGATWTCAASAGSTCPAASGTGSLSITGGYTLAPGGALTFTINGVLDPNATCGAAIGNTASADFSATDGFIDINTANNSATASFNVLCRSLTLTKVSNNGTGSFTFTGNNGWASQTIATTSAGTGVTGAPQVLTNAGTATTITETLPTDWRLSGVACTGMGVGGTATVSGSSFTLNAAAVGTNSTIACTVTNAPVPRVTISKVSLGGTGAFSFTGSNGIAAQTLTTTVAGTAVSGTPQTLTAVGAVTTITESAPPAGYTLTGISCTNLPSGGTATPNLATRTVTLNAAATAAGANATCTFTNALVPRVTISKVSLGGTGAFSFTGSNGIAAQTLTTTVAGTAVSGTPQALTAVGAVTTITESAPPAGYTLTGISCTNLPSGGTATPNLATRTVTLNAAATAAGANATCTFTNTLTQPALSITKTSNGPWTIGQTGATYTLNVSNAGNLATTGTITVRDQLPTGIGIRPATGFIAATGWTCSYSDEAAQSATTIVPNTGMLVTCTSNTAISVGGTVALTLPVVVTSAASASVTNYASIGGGGDPFNGGAAPTAGPACTDVTHCTRTTTSITSSPPAPATCPAGAPVNLFATAPFQSNFFTDNSTETRTATLLPTAGGYSVGTGSGGRFVVDMNWRWSPGFPLPSNAATMTLQVNGVNYAIMTTQAGFAGFATLVAQNGATLFGGTTAVETNRTSNENIWVALPAAVTAITSVQMVYAAGSTADDFFFSGPALYGCPGSADLSVTKTSTTSPVTPGGNIAYSIVATNNGPSAVANPIVSENWTALPGLDCSTTTGGGIATCVASGTAGTQCPATVTPELLQTGLAIPALPSGGVVTFTLLCRVTATGQ